jgi:hypothetical protein
MSRSRNRARHRRKRLETGLREAVIRARKADSEAAHARVVTPGKGELWRLFRDLERADLQVWNVARAIHCTEDEKAMIAKAVAPDLAGCRCQLSRRKKQAKWEEIAVPETL